MPLRPQDVLMGLAVPLIWGLGVVFAKAAIEHFPPILLMAIRFTLTALVLVWFVKPPWRVMGQLVAIAFISATIMYSLTFTGLRGLDASTAVLVIQLEVLFFCCWVPRYCTSGSRRTSGWALPSPWPASD